jgi:hypothetical protein
LPDATRDRVWRYNHHSGMSFLPEGFQGQAPRIAVLSKERVSWEPPAHGEEIDLDAHELDPQVMDRRRWPGRIPPRDMRDYAIALRV